MSDSSTKQSWVRVAVVPFTGPIFAVYAFFWPESFGNWWGTIVHAFRVASGF